MKNNNLLIFLILLNLTICITATVAYINLEAKIETYHDNLISDEMTKFLQNEGHGKVFTEYDME
jgi:hypothetical protein